MTNEHEGQAWLARYTEQRDRLIEANAYNPNSVAAPEMKLLQRSIEADGYTQPIVAFAGLTRNTFAITRLRLKCGWG